MESSTRRTVNAATKHDVPKSQPSRRAQDLMERSDFPPDSPSILNRQRARSATRYTPPLDAGGIETSSQWLSEATPPDRFPFPSPMHSGRSASLPRLLRSAAKSIWWSPELREAARKKIQCFPELKEAAGKKI